MRDGRFGFDDAVERGGYQWWYVDAVSDDGQHRICLIAFIGSVFSPYYANALRRGSADPEDHCAINVALYGPQGSHWAMTERGARALRRDASSLRIGPSALQWDGTSLVFQLNEVTCPLPRSIRGEVRLTPGAIFDQEVALDTAQRHWWRPISPSARVSVHMDAPKQCWSGNGYLDSNGGTEPIDRGLKRWDWARCTLPDGHVVFYDIAERNAHKTTICAKFGQDGTITTFAPPPMRTLPMSRWRIVRNTRSEGEVDSVAALEDTPFYARSIVNIQLAGEQRACVHESLDLDRLRSPMVQMMLPFRMPRRRSWREPQTTA